MPLENCQAGAVTCSLTETLYFFWYKTASFSSLQSTLQSQQKLVWNKPESHVFILLKEKN